MKQADLDRLFDDFKATGEVKSEDMVITDDGWCQVIKKGDDSWERKAGSTIWELIKPLVGNL